MFCTYMFTIIHLQNNLIRSAPLFPPFSDGEAGNLKSGFIANVEPQVSFLSVVSLEHIVKKTLRRKKRDDDFITDNSTFIY